MRLTRSTDYRLAYWERASGYGLVVGGRDHDAIILPPLSLMAFTFSDEDFDARDFRNFLAQFEDVAPVLEGGAPERSLDELHARGILASAQTSGAQDEPIAPGGGTVPPLLSLYVYGTNRCNHGCFHCYQPTRRQGDDTPSIEAGEPTTRQILDLIDEAIPLGLRSIKFTGGEPFLRSDLLVLVAEAADRGMRTSIESNGTGMTGEAAAALARSRTQVSISLDGSTSALHDRLRGKRGAFDAALRAIDCVVDAGGALKVITAVSRRNIHDLEQIATLLADHGVKGWKINPVNSLGDSTLQRAAADMLDPLDVNALFTGLRDSGIGGRNGLSLFLEGPPAFFSLREIAEAGCGTCPFLNVLGLLADGRLSFCGIGYSEESLVLGHIASVSLAEMWRDHPVLQTARATIPEGIVGVCRDCVFLGSCRGSCRAIAYQGQKSFGSAHPWCQALKDAERFPTQYLGGASEARHTPA